METARKAELLEELRLSYLEYVRRAEQCETYDGAKRWIERAHEVATEAYRLRTGL